MAILSPVTETALLESVVGGRETKTIEIIPRKVCGRTEDRTCDLRNTSPTDLANTASINLVLLCHFIHDYERMKPHNPFSNHAKSFSMRSVF